MMHPVSKLFLFTLLAWTALCGQAAPVIDPVADVNIPAGKSLTIPITASSPNGQPLAYTVTSGTNRITVEAHTNNPFWRMSIVQIAPPGSPGSYQTTFRGASVLVTNVGDLTFMLFKDRAPRTVEVFTGFSHAGFYNSNTIFHRVIPGFMIQGGDPATNGTGGPVFRFDDEFHPRAIFSGNGQLAMANSGKDSNGSQFFVTFGTPRHLDFNHTIFGQLLRGFAVQTNVVNTPRNASDRPLRDVILQRASIVTNTTDTVITLTGTNLAGVSGTIRVIADDGAGGRTTNTFTATTVSDAANNAPAILKTPAITNLFVPANTNLTSFIQALDLEGNNLFYYAEFLDAASAAAATNSSLSANGALTIGPNQGYTGPVSFRIYASHNNFDTFDSQAVTFSVGDTPVAASAANFLATPLVGFTNQLLATFTNGVVNSSATNFTAYINWGDNSTNVGTILTNANGQKEVRGSHTYTNSGHYPVYVTIQSRLGASATVISTAIVPPSLSFTRTGTNNAIRWPAWAAEYVLQSHTNLNTPNWSAITNQVILVGYENLVTNSTTASNRYFRLKR